jgi:menaquinone-dependent protoporphyrinogen oxidase
MRVLIAYASAHGSTEEIAARVGMVLRQNGLDADVVPAEEAPGLEGYDAFVIGSAIHNSSWLTPAERFVTREAPSFAGRPVWLFSVATVGASSSGLGAFGTWMARKAGRIPKDLPALIARTGAKGHRTFAGVIRRDDWGRVGDLFVRLMGGRYGDHRDWHDIEHWATTIATALTARSAAARVQG